MRLEGCGGQTSASWFETRGVYHRAALRADPLALLTMRIEELDAPLARGMTVPLSKMRLVD